MNFFTIRSFFDLLSPLLFGVVKLLVEVAVVSVQNFVVSGLRLSEVAQSDTSWGHELLCIESLLDVDTAERFPVYV